MKQNIQEPKKITVIVRDLPDYYKDTMVWMYNYNSVVEFQASMCC